MKIQFLSFPGCPSAPGALSSLRRVLAATGVADPIEEVDMTAPETPEELRDWGSPTILVDGLDVEGETTPNGPGCRLYEGADEARPGVPPDAVLVAAIQRAARGA